MGQYYSCDHWVERTYDSDSDWDTLRGTGNTLGTAGRGSRKNSDVTGAGGGSCIHVSDVLFHVFSFDESSPKISELGHSDGRETRTNCTDR